MLDFCMLIPHSVIGRLAADFGGPSNHIMTICCQKLKVSGFSAAAGLKNGQFDRKCETLAMYYYIRLNIEHRTSNVEHRIVNSVYFIKKAPNFEVMTSVI